MAGSPPDSSLVLSKHEVSVFVNKILKMSRGIMRVRIDFGKANLSMANDTFSDSVMSFGREFQSNGTYLIEKAYCKRKSKRNLIFEDLAASNVEKGDLLAIIDFS